MRYIWIILALLIVSSCQDEKVATPRPKQYPRIIWPDNHMVTQELPQCQFRLNVPAYAEIVQKKQDSDQAQQHPCWFDIRMSVFSATMYCSYYRIDKLNTYSKLVDDAYTMVSKHNVKANSRDEIAIQTTQGSKGIIFKIAGPVATPYQFFLSDTSSHFIRGSLYFDNKLDQDSMDMIKDLLIEDMNNVVGSIQWKN